MEVKERLSWLDELRGVAALSVVLIHYSFLLSTQGDHFLFVDSFARGVQMFYLLSGYILFALYKDKALNNGWHMDFLLKRFFRVGPLFYFILAVIFITKYPVVDGGYGNYLLHLLFIPFGFYRDYINGIIG